MDIIKKLGYGESYDPKEAKIVIDFCLVAGIIATLVLLGYI